MVVLDRGGHAEEAEEPQAEAEVDPEADRHPDHRPDQERELVLSQGVEVEAEAEAEEDEAEEGPYQVHSMSVRRRLFLCFR